MVALIPAQKLQLCRGVAEQTRRGDGRGAGTGSRLRAILGLGLLGCAASGAAPGQPAAGGTADVAVSSTLERIVAESAAGAAATVPIESGTAASHADELIVSVRFANRSGSVVDTVRLTSAIPADVKYVPGSASGPGSRVLFSVDSGRSFGSPAELTLAAAGGGTRAADAADYTHVRWVLSAPLAPGATGIARFRAVPR